MIKLPFDHRYPMDSLVNFWADALEARLDRERQLRAIENIRRSFLAPAPGGLEPIPYRPYLGLGLFVNLRQQRSREYRQQHPAPFGWRWMGVLDRNALILMPAWLYYPVRAWTYRWWAMDYPLRWGWIRMKEDGGYWREARPRCPSWLYCFLHDLDRDPRPWPLDFWGR